MTGGVAVQGESRGGRTALQGTGADGPEKRDMLVDVIEYVGGCWEALCFCGGTGGCEGCGWVQ